MLQKITISEAQWIQICDNNIFEENPLGKLLREIEFLSAGKAWIDIDTFWISGDNGMREVKLEIVLPFIVTFEFI